VVISGTGNVYPGVMAPPGIGSAVGLGHRGDADEDEAAAASYARHFDPAFGRRFAERALDALVVVRGGRVLDVACGTGVFARLSAHVVGRRGGVVGIDPSAVAVTTARRVDPTSIVDWRQWDDGRLPFEDGSFDVVACQHALHRFPDPDRVLAEMRRVLAPGGRLGITTWGPIEENPAFAAQLDAAVKAGLDQSGVVESLLEPFAWHRSADLEQLARRAGLVDVSCQTVKMLCALPRVADWVRVYPSLPPLSRVWWRCDQKARVQFLARATELLRPFEHDSVLRVQASSRLLVARRQRH
jgi:SAM-dependent methyltransferase